MTICIGAALNDVILFTAYRTNDLNDHLDSPASRSCTSNSTYVVLNPTQDDNARKNTFRSGSFRNSSAACRSINLKSDALDISIPVASLIIL